MAQSALSLKTIGDLDGGLAQFMIDREIARAVADTDDRGEDGQARKVVIEVTLKKLSNGQVDTTLACQAKLPALKSRSTFANLKSKDGKSELLFQSLSPNNPDQQTFPSLEQEESE